MKSLDRSGPKEICTHGQRTLNPLDFQGKIDSLTTFTVDFSPPELRKAFGCKRFNVRWPCLQKLSNRLDIEIRVAHYSPYCSKYNPIEHRLFPHLTRACRGVIFHTLEAVQYYMAKAETTTGLKVKVGLLDKVYRTGRKYAAGFKKNMKLVFDKVLPKWNYRALPELM